MFSLWLGAATVEVWLWSKCGDEFQSSGARPLVSYSSHNWRPVRCILILPTPKFPKLLVPRNSEWNLREKGQKIPFSLIFQSLLYRPEQQFLCCDFINPHELASCGIVLTSGGGHDYLFWGGREPCSGCFLRIVCLYHWSET